MIHSPYITIYTAGDFDYGWIKINSIKATLIFSKHLPYNKQLARKRVNIYLSDEERIDTHGSIKSIWIKNTIDISVELNDADKIQIFLKIIYDCLMRFAEIEGWDVAPFAKAYQLSIADNGNYFWHSKLKTNRSRSLKARIKLLLDDDLKVSIIVEVFDNKSQLIFETMIIETFQFFIDWERVFDKPIWLNNERFGFNFLDSQLLIFANTISRQSEIVISAKGTSLEEIERKLRLFSLDTWRQNKF